MSTTVEMHRIKNGLPVKVVCTDRGLRAFRGRLYYTSRFEIEGRKSPLIVRVDAELADKSGNNCAFRMSEDMAALEAKGITW